MKMHAQTPMEQISDASPKLPDDVRTLFSSISGRYDLANHLLSGGMDLLWRFAAGRRVASWRPERILDVAAGSGDLALEMQRACPGAELIATDFCPPMLELARKKGVHHTLVADALNLPFPSATFDVVTVAFGLRNMASYTGALHEFARVLRPGGHLLILDFSIPTEAFRPFYRFYLHYILPHLAAMLTGSHSAYEYLGASIEQFPCGDAMCTLLNANGFHSAEAQPMTFGIVTLYAAEKQA